MMLPYVAACPTLVRNTYLLAKDQPVHQCEATARMLRRAVRRMERQRLREPTPWLWAWKRYRMN